MKMRRRAPVRFVPGPAITPAGELLAWLDSHAETESGDMRRFRLPVVVRFDGHAQIDAIFIGGSEASLDTDAIALDVDDGAMGVGLQTSIQAHFAGEGSGCAVWLEGNWGRLFDPGSGLGTDTGVPIKKAFSALAVGDLIDASAASTIRVHVEAPRD